MKFYLLLENEQKTVVLKYLQDNPNINFSCFYVKYGAPCARNTVTKLFGSFSEAKRLIGNTLFNPNPLVRLFANRIINDNGCWIWTGKTLNDYGQITHLKKQYAVHRFSYKISYGEIPQGKIVRHKCDNKLCFNPEHLELGTYQDNTLDLNERQEIKYTKSIIVPKHNSIEQRIEWYVKLGLTLENGCIISGNKKPKPDGYYQIKFKNKNYYLHRKICAITYNKDYNDKTWEASHKCQNKFCINADHLKPLSRSEHQKYQRSLKV